MGINQSASMTDFLSGTELLESQEEIVNTNLLINKEQ